MHRLTPFTGSNVCMSRGMSYWSSPCLSGSKPCKYCGPECTIASVMNIAIILFADWIRTVQRVLPCPRCASLHLHRSVWRSLLKGAFYIENKMHNFSFHKVCHPSDILKFLPSNHIQYDKLYWKRLSVVTVYTTVVGNRTRNVVSALYLFFSLVILMLELIHIKPPDPEKSHTSYMDEGLCLRSI